MKLGIALVAFGGFTLALNALLFILPISHNWDWIDLFWIVVGSLCLYFGVGRLRREERKIKRAKQNSDLEKQR